MSPEILERLAELEATVLKALLDLQAIRNVIWHEKGYPDGTFLVGDTVMIEARTPALQEWWGRIARVSSIDDYNYFVTLPEGNTLTVHLRDLRKA